MEYLVPIKQEAQPLSQVVERIVGPDVHTALELLHEVEVVKCNAIAVTRSVMERSYNLPAEMQSVLLDHVRSISRSVTNEAVAVLREQAAADRVTLEALNARIAMLDAGLKQLT